MPKEGRLVEQLGSLIDQGKDFEGYYAPIIIRLEGGEKYVLKCMSKYKDESDKNRIKKRHTKLEFTSRQELVEAFQRIAKRLSLDRSLSWQETTSTCSYNIPEEEFEIAMLLYDISREDRRS